MLPECHMQSPAYRASQYQGMEGLFFPGVTFSQQDFPTASTQQKNKQVCQTNELAAS